MVTICGDNLATLTYIKEEMRYHLVGCLENKLFTPFPTSREPSEDRTCSVSLINFAAVEDQQDMVGCDGCNKRFHLDCSGLVSDIHTGHGQMKTGIAQSADSSDIQSCDIVVIATILFNKKSLTSYAGRIVIACVILVVVEGNLGYLIVSLEKLPSSGYILHGALILGNTELSSWDRFSVGVNNLGCFFP